MQLQMPETPEEENALILTSLGNLINVVLRRIVRRMTSTRPNPTALTVQEDK